MNRDHLLIEIGTEELPPTALKALSESFAGSVSQSLVEAQLLSPESAAQMTVFASPRRLALLLPEVSDQQPDQTEQRRGPAVAAAFDANAEPTPAAKGFARSCGVEVDQLERLATDKGEWLSFTIEQPGQRLAELLAAILETAVKQLPIPKRMRWGDGDAEFVRPAHWLLVLHGAEIVNTSLLGLQAGRTTRGHRFHSKGLIELASADSYAQCLLHEGDVVASFSERQQLIKKQISELANGIQAQLDEDQDLLDEVTALVEKPVALLGNFDSAFLEVPSECLISAMRDHQKYFHLRSANGELAPHFITVSNIDSKDPARVVAGNERVLRARLSDARFFWENDRKQTLHSRLPGLDSVLFHAKLGSLGQKKERIKTLAKVIAAQINADSGIATRAAELAKADLISDMVGEFDKLQGIMGHYYADLDGEHPQVGAAIEQHYWPRYAGDQLPVTGEAQAVALADRLDNLVGIYAAGEVPTGDRDPYSLRRAALGILRILIEKQLPLSVADLVGEAAGVYASQDFKVQSETQADISRFILDRLMAYYQGQGIGTSAIHAVAACEPAKPLDFDRRLQAVRSFNELEQAADLAAANKRISNILKKQNHQVADSIEPALLVEKAEQELFVALQNAEREALVHFDRGNYDTGLSQLAALRSPIDDFFENVMVMSEDAAQQSNRLALLKRLQALFLRVADISQLQG